MNEVAGGGIIQDVKDLLEIGKTVGEMVSAFIDGSEGKTRTRILTLSTMEAMLTAAGKKVLEAVATKRNRTYKEM